MTAYPDGPTGPGAVLDVVARAWLQTEDLTSWLVTDGLRVLGTVVAALAVRWLAHRAIDKLVATASDDSDRRFAERSGVRRAVAAATGTNTARHSARMATTGSLLKSIASVLIFSVALLTVLSMIGIPLGPMLASAGIGGVALGFGAQSVVKDFLSGIFMILEDQYGVGDIIDTGEATGTVEAVSLRITRLRDINGVTWHVRNGEIVRIGNHSQGRSSAVVDIPFSHRENVDRVIEVIQGALSTMVADEAWSEELIEDPQVLGVEDVAPGMTTVRVLASCQAGSKWQVQREVRRRVKDAFDEHDIAGPELTLSGTRAEP